MDFLRTELRSNSEPVPSQYLTFFGGPDLGRAGTALPANFSAFCAAVLLLVFFVSPAKANTAFFYAGSPPIAELAAHDRVVLDPRLVTDEQVAKLRATGTDVHAYVSIGEIEPADVLFNSLPANALLATNPGWQTRVVDLAHPAWVSLVLDKRIKPLAARGFSGLFLDTLDSYQLTKDVEGQRRALTNLLTRIQRDFPELALVMNRGFEVLEELPNKVAGVVAESLYKSFNPATREYRDVPANDQEWLLGKFADAKQRGAEIIVIDYLPTLGAEAVATAKRIAAHGFTPWVTDPSLTNLGVSRIVPEPRRILVLHNDADKKIAERDAHTLFGAALDWYGYVVDFHDIRSGPPKLVKGVHVGAMMWMQAKETKTLPWFDEWLLWAKKEQMKLLFLGALPTKSAAVMEELGLKHLQISQKAQAVAISRKSSWVGEFEAPVRLRKYQIPMLLSTHRDNKPALEIELDNKMLAHPVLTAPWGALAQHPYVVEDFGEGRRKFIIDPFELVSRAFGYEPRPVFDTTTENGRRLLMIHVDGDGFVSRAFLPGAPLSAAVLLDQFIKGFALPHTISVIEGEIAATGLYPKQHAEFEAIARQIFKEPNVELASHSYSHPFFWRTAVLDQSQEKKYGLHLPIPGYTVDLEREIVGSVNYIDKNLAPPGKRTKVFLWSGTADPDARALKKVAQAGLVNVNGGNTIALQIDKTLTTVWPQARVENGGMQVYAPIMNENVFTGNWTGPYYGFRKAIETFDLTESPRRLKPINIYYHFYSATKPASLLALREVYNAAIASDGLPLYLSEFAELVANYYQASLVKDLDGRWRVSNAGALRTLRIPQSLGYPHGKQIAGYADVNNDRYLHLSSQNLAFRLTGQRRNEPELHSANVRLQKWQPTADGKVELHLSGYQDIELSIHSAENCSIALGDGSRHKARSKANVVTFSLPVRDTGDAILVCK